MTSLTTMIVMFIMFLCWAVATVLIANYCYKIGKESRLEPHQVKPKIPKGLLKRATKEEKAQDEALIRGMQNMAEYTGFPKQGEVSDG